MEALEKTVNGMVKLTSHPVYHIALIVFVWDHIAFLAIFPMPSSLFDIEIKKKKN